MKRLIHTVLLAALILSTGCTAQLFGTTWSSKPAAVDKIRVGDTMDAVIKKIGQPQQVMLEQITEIGRRRVEWRYPAFSKIRRSFSGTVEPLAPDPVSVKSQTTQSGSGSEYVVIFEDGRVLFMFERQK